MEKEFFECVLIHYNIGEFRSAQRLRKGFANTNYKIVTSGGVFLFRICKEKNLDEQIRIQNFLKEKKYKTAYPLKRSDGTYTTVVGGMNVALYDFIVGEEPRIHKCTVQEIARAAAQLNSFDVAGVRPYPVSIQKCRQLIASFPKGKSDLSELLDFFKAQTSLLQGPLAEKLPAGLIHGDLFTDNTLFDGGKLVAIIDFGDVSVDSRLIEIGVAINGFCFVRNALNISLMNLFLKEYESCSKKKILKKERELLFDYVVWGAHAMMFYHIRDVLESFNKRKYKRAVYLMNRITKLRKVENKVKNSAMGGKEVYEKPPMLT